MARIEKLSVSWHGLLPVFSNLVKQWKPPICNSELLYRDDLLSFIRAAVPDGTKVEKEYRHRGTTIDIWIGWSGLMQKGELAIELKRDLKKKTDYDRLVGQIEGLSPRNIKVLVVLVGDTDAGLVGRLKDNYSKLLDDSYGDAQMSIVCVEVKG